MNKLAIDGGLPVRKKENFLTFGAPQIEKQDIEEVLECFRSRWIGTGPKVHQFEKDFAIYKGTKHAIALNSCTAALHLAMLSTGIGPGDEVITSPMTFCATINAIIHCGATPVLADCDLDTMNILPSPARPALSADTGRSPRRSRWRAPTCGRNSESLSTRFPAHPLRLLRI